MTTDEGDTPRSASQNPGRSLSGNQRGVPPLVDPSGLVGPTEMALRIGISPATVRTWKRRRQLPEPLAVVSGVPLWERETVKAWWLAKMGHED